MNSAASLASSFYTLSSSLSKTATKAYSIRNCAEQSYFILCLLASKSIGSRSLSLVFRSLVQLARLLDLALGFTFLR